MKQGADDQHAAAATANAVCLGVQEEDTVNANDPTSVVMSGEAVIICGAAVSAGQFLISDASGHAIPSTTAGDNVVAQAISSATSAGDFFVGQIVKFIR
jgi:hypothetical protein